MPDISARIGKPLQPAPRGAIEREAAAVRAFGGRFLFADDPAYPPLLGQLTDVPPVLTVKGEAALATRSCIAMVGARNASAAACRFARELAHELAAQGMVVVSGLARGIDAAAHQGALGAPDGGSTIGVIAGGIDVAYPPEHEALQAEVAARGLLIAEMAVGTEPRARHFPYRNRIIAGLSLGTIVVEAAPKSGSLITARLANEAGREVMAVPGTPLDPRSRGCNALIREGATLIQDADDVMEAIGGFAADRPRSPPLRDQADLFTPARDPDATERDAVLDLMSHSFVAVDELIRQSGLGAPEVASVLLDLELAGRLERGAGQRVRLADPT